MSETRGNLPLDEAVDAMRMEELMVVSRLFLREWRQGGHVELGSNDVLDLTVSGGIQASGPMVAEHDYIALKETPEGALVEAPFEARYFIDRDVRDGDMVPTAIAKVVFDLSEEKAVRQQQFELYEAYAAGRLEGPLGPFTDQDLAEKAYQEQQRNLRLRHRALVQRRHDALPDTRRVGPKEQLVVAHELRRVLERALPIQLVTNAQEEHNARLRQH